MTHLCVHTHAWEGSSRTVSQRGTSSSGSNNVEYLLSILLFEVRGSPQGTLESHVWLHVCVYLCVSLCYLKNTLVLCVHRNGHGVWDWSQDNFETFFYRTGHRAEGLGLEGRYLTSKRPNRDLNLLLLELFTMNGDIFIANHSRSAALAWLFKQMS